MKQEMDKKKIEEQKNYAKFYQAQKHS